jgi:uncharacterized OB-fold protein
MTGESVPFTIESFYNFVSAGKLMGAKCRRCGQLLVPPKPMCSACFSTDLKWKELPREGTLQTYTVIHVSPKQFQGLVPYAVGIVKLDDDAQLPGMIRGVPPDKLKVGMNLTVDFEKAANPEEWPQWPRYYFKPTHPA